MFCDLHIKPTILLNPDLDDIDKLIWAIINTLNKVQFCQEIIDVDFIKERTRWSEAPIRNSIAKMLELNLIGYKEFIICPETISYVVI